MTTPQTLAEKLAQTAYEMQREEGVFEKEFLEAFNPILTTHFAETRRVLEAAANVGEIRFGTCVLSAQVADDIQTLLSTLP